jgi:uncharacterized protein (TIGR03086 family)
MLSGMTDPAARQDLDIALHQFRVLLAEVGPDDLDRRTPCDDWTVSAVVDHVVHGLGNFTSMVKGDEVDWSAQPAQVAANPVPVFDAAADELRAAWEQSAGQMGPEMQCAELAVHTWDLARGLGRDTADLDQGVAERGLAFMQANLTDDNRGQAFKPEQTAPDGADAYTRIAAFAGRTA